MAVVGWGLAGILAKETNLVAMTSRNAGSVRTRTVGTALYNMCVQTSNIISSNVSPSPQYGKKKTFVHNLPTTYTLYSLCSFETLS